MQSAKKSTDASQQIADRSTTAAVIAAGVATSIVATVVAASVIAAAIAAAIATAVVAATAWRWADGHGNLFANRARNANRARIGNLFANAM